MPIISHFYGIIIRIYFNDREGWKSIKKNYKPYGMYLKMMVKYLK